MHDRYMPVIVWSTQSWTHNFFRGYEWIFGRRFGIRTEASTTVFAEKGKNRIELRSFYTWESVIAHGETLVRSTLWELVYAHRMPPAFAYASLVGLWVLRRNIEPLGIELETLPLFSLAIAFDDSTSATDTSVSSLTFAHTSTGTDLTLTGGSGHNNNTDILTSTTYAAVAVTLINSVQNPTTSRFRYLNLKVGPATGANNYVITLSTTSDRIVGAVITHTGVSQTGQPDAQNTQTVASATSATSTLNSVADLCRKIVWWNSQAQIPAAGTNTTSREVIDAHILGDSGETGITPAGAFDMTATVGGAATGWSINALTLAPAGAAAGVTFVPWQFFPF